MGYQVLADAVLIVHLAFVLFVVLGGFGVARFPRLLWLHVPAVIWGALIELRDWTCPLTPLENRLRARSGGPVYEETFLEHYLIPLIYPEQLTRPLQLVLGISVLVVNGVIYAWILRHRRSRL
jgi:hypothetical protein